MNPRTLLAGLLRQQTSTDGRVLSISDGMASVATPAGLVKASFSGTLSTGDRVTVSGGVVVRRSLADSGRVVSV